MVTSVVIVGGGTAGWMTASYLKAAFSDRLSVTLVESNNVPTIGVGEATFSTVRHFFSYLGLDEREWMPECQATYKLAIRFDGWRAPEHTFYHPFERPRTVGDFSLADWWLHANSGGRFDQDTSLIASLCEAQSSPRHLDGSLFAHGEQGSQFPYAYHFDAAMLARYLTGYGTRRGVRHVLDDVLDVAVTPDGSISGVRTAQHGELTADLYIDCTGFRSVLMGKALGEPFRSYQDTLPNDRAVALRVPADMKARGIRPYTTASAQDAGWIWTIPLFGRIGTGYVYASDYCTPEEAERDLRAFVGPEADELEANHIRMRIGRSERSWVRNCVAIGLSSGFVEPLESTGIFFIQNAVEQLVRHFPGGTGGDEPLRRAYNQQVGRVMDGVREFLVLHYYAAARSDNDYWRDAKSRPLPDGLAERIEQWRGRLPDETSVFPHFHGFDPYSYAVMVLGLGGIPLQPLPALGLLDRGPAEETLELIRGEARDLVANLPSQYDYVAHLHRAPRRPVVAAAR